MRKFISHVTLQKLIACFLGLATAILLAFAMGPWVLGFQIDQELKSNCKNYSNPKAEEKRIVIDIDENTVSVSDINDDYLSVLIPFKSEKSDIANSGCSNDAITLMHSAYEVYREYIDESCMDFQNILNGKSSLPVRNGTTANIKGAQDFVTKYCKN